MLPRPQRNAMAGADIPNNNFMKNEKNNKTAGVQADPGTPQTIKDRLLAFLRHKRVKRIELTRQLGVSPAYINAIRKSLPEERVQQLCALYPDLSRDWLLFGEGDMLVEPQVSAPVSDYEVPLLPVHAFAGSLQEWSQGVEAASCERVLSTVPGVDMAIRISGDSMEPELHDGSILYIKRINDRSFIPWGNPLVIDTENGVLVKALYPVADDPTTLEARSFNPNYPPIRIPGRSLYGLYRVVGVTKHYATM